MTLTPEQFNQLVTKEEHNRLEQKIDGIANNVQKILTVLDGVTKDVEDIKTEQTANVAAHDRFQQDIDALKVHTGLHA